jgi:hypothetical protein
VPDRFGVLTPEETQVATKWLSDHWGNSACPFHGQTSWEVGHVVMTIAYGGGDIVLGGPTYPLLTVTCNVCGYTVFVNAIKAGVVSVQQASQLGISTPKTTPESSQTSDG